MKRSFAFLGFVILPFVVHAEINSSEREALAAARCFGKVEVLLAPGRDGGSPREVVLMNPLTGTLPDQWSQYTERVRIQREIFSFFQNRAIDIAPDNVARILREQQQLEDGTASKFVRGVESIVLFLGGDEARAFFSGTNPSRIFGYWSDEGDKFHLHPTRTFAAALARIAAELPPEEKLLALVDPQKGVAGSLFGSGPRVKTLSTALRETHGFRADPAGPIQCDHGIQ